MTPDQFSRLASLAERYQRLHPKHAAVVDGGDLVEIVEEVNRLRSVEEKWTRASHMNCNAAIDEALAERDAERARCETLVHKLDDIAAANLVLQRRVETLRIQLNNECETSRSDRYRVERLIESVVADRLTHLGTVLAMVGALEQQKLKTRFAEDAFLKMMGFEPVDKDTIAVVMPDDGSECISHIDHVLNR
jgi:hypothetical protein